MGIELRNIKSEIERTKCTVHSSNPEMIINGDKFTLKCCCEQFKDQSVKKVHSLLVEEGKRSITESLNKAFKKLR